MAVATSSDEVGVRDLKNNLSRHLQRVKDGGELIVTERGRPVARVIPIDVSTDRLADLIARGLAKPPRNAVRHKPAPPIDANGTVSDLVAEQRR